LKGHRGNGDTKFKVKQTEVGAKSEVKRLGPNYVGKTRVNSSSSSNQLHRFHHLAVAEPPSPAAAARPAAAAAASSSSSSLNHIVQRDGHASVSGF